MEGLKIRPKDRWFALSSWRGSIPLMALRIRQSLVRGEIDNRRRGRVEGWITLAGVARPLMLELTGNCLRDLGGSGVRCANPHPLTAEDEKNLPAPWQRGVAGETTA